MSNLYQRCRPNAPFWVSVSELPAPQIWRDTCQNGRFFCTFSSVWGKNRVKTSVETLRMLSCFLQKPIIRCACRSFSEATKVGEYGTQGTISGMGCGAVVSGLRKFTAAEKCQGLPYLEGREAMESERDSSEITLKDSGPWVQWALLDLVWSIWFDFERSSDNLVQACLQRASKEKASCKSNLTHYTSWSLFFRHQIALEVGKA